MKIALLSVYDKTGIVELGKELINKQYVILSTGGTAKKLREGLGDAANHVVEVQDYTGFPESPNGLVKTLQPQIHAGLLMDVRNVEHFSYMMRTGSFPIDFVAVNLYPFQETVKKNKSFEDTVEQIDIGGPTMLRSAAKGMLLNGRPLVVVDPRKYSIALDWISHQENKKGCCSEHSEKNKSCSCDCNNKSLLHDLALDVYKHTEEFDANIVSYLEDKLLKNTEE